MRKWKQCPIRRHWKTVNQCSDITADVFWNREATVSSFHCAVGWAYSPYDKYRKWEHAQRVISRIHAGRRPLWSQWHGPFAPPPSLTPHTHTPRLREIWADNDGAPVVIEGGDSSHEDKTELGSHLRPESWNQQFPDSLIRSGTWEAFPVSARWLLTRCRGVEVGERGGGGERSCWERRKETKRKRVLGFLSLCLFFRFEYFACFEWVLVWSGLGSHLFQ